MVLAVVLAIWGGCGILMLRSGKEAGDILQRASCRLYKKIHMWSWLRAGMKKREEQVMRNLISLHPGGTSELLLQEYYVSKIRILLLILLAGSGIAGCAEAVNSTNGIKIVEGRLSRPEKQQTIILEAMVEGAENNIVNEKITLLVGERTLTDAEAEASYKNLLHLLEKEIAGQNVSLQEVRENLHLPYQVEGYPFSMQWKSSNHTLLTSDGTVHVENLDMSEKVILTVEVSYGEKQWTHSWEIVLCPPKRTEQEQLMYELNKLTRETEEMQKYEENFLLPQEIRDKKISWTIPRENTGKVILLLTCSAAVAVFYMKDKDLQAELVKRRREMRAEYPVIVSKYALFLEAGMTVRGAFIKICKDYYEKNKNRAQPIYEEMYYSCNELKAGVSESTVYENFGRRTGVQEYTRMCALLTQNLKKGNTALAKRLMEESNDAVTESLRTCKRQGEEAGTKLLAPMGMMLIMVLVMIMLPAFYGLGI